MGFSVLIVDDSSAMRAFVRRVMDMSGFEVGQYFEAADGEEALRVLERNWVDVILTDINMPRMDGTKLLERLERNELMRSIPVIVISTDATQNRMHQMMVLGAKSYVTKPFLPETLRAEMEKVLGVEHA